jgi:hypothetical protein
VLAGTDSDGTIIYVGRAHHEGDVMAAKVLPDKEAAYISYNGEEILKNEIEVNYLLANQLIIIYDYSSYMSNQYPTDSDWRWI